MSQRGSRGISDKKKGGGTSDRSDFNQIALKWVFVRCEERIKYTTRFNDVCLSYEIKYVFLFEKSVILMQILSNFLVEKCNIRLFFYVFHIMTFFSFKI